MVFQYKTTTPAKNSMSFNDYEFITKIKLKYFEIL